MEECELEFDFINVEAPFANALRRILLAEVPTMAIDRVHLFQNTSLIQDEVFCHRLGLVPIKVDPRLFTSKIASNSSTAEDPQSADTAENTIEFQLHVKCTKNLSALKENTDPDDLYTNSKIFSRDLKWVPIGNQAQKFQKDPPRPVHPDILLNKLRPGQEVELKCFCVKGIGRDHAKFSPVATASYRLLPEITLKRQIEGEAAERLKESFSDGVIELIDRGDGVKVARVKDARRDMCSRNVFRYSDLADAVLLTRHRRHFIFSVESTGALPSNVLVVEACKAMREKCRSLLNELKSF